MEAVAVFSSSSVYGYVIMVQKDDYVEINVDLFKPGKTSKNISLHGFHIHSSGDLRRGCDSCCKHYNPTGAEHGGLDGGHAGDLGNLEFDEKGNCKTTLITSKFTVQEVVGRSLIVHEDEDDLGLGDNEESKKTGNSGKRIACSILAYAESICEK
jgi:Cu-Zn family superoxide dismutase